MNGKRLWPNVPAGAFGALGANYNNICVIPEWNMVVVREGLDIAGADPGILLEQIGRALIPHDELMAVLPSMIYTVIDNDFNDQGDTFSNHLLKPAGGVGEDDIEGSNAMSRLIARFELPGSSSAASLLQRATLRFFLEDIIGTPDGPASVFHSVSHNGRVRKSEYEDGSYEDTQWDLVQPDDASQQYYEVDVTKFVLDDYAGDSLFAISAFRLQIDEAVFDEDNLSHRYVFTMPGAEANRPELVLTFIPEPSTLVLTAIGFFGLVASGRHRRREVG